MQWWVQFVLIFHNSTALQVEIAAEAPTNDRKPNRTPTPRKREDHEVGEAAREEIYNVIFGTWSKGTMVRSAYSGHLSQAEKTQIIGRLLATPCHQDYSNTKKATAKETNASS